MTTVWLPEVDGADAATAGVPHDEHGGQIALLNLLKTKQHRRRITCNYAALVTMETDDGDDDDSDLQFGSSRTASRRRGAQSAAQLPQRKRFNFKFNLLLLN